MPIRGSARIISNEIDNSAVSPVEILPTGTPAAVIGTSKRGPAFIPKTVANINQFGDIFGNIKEVSQKSNSNKFGPLALDQWLKNANAGTFIRVLGVGNGLAATNGSVTDAGFKLGSKLIDPSTNKISDNKYASLRSADSAKDLALRASRTYALGCFMTDSSDSDYLSGSGIDTSTHPFPIVRGLLMTPQGVIASLETAGTTSETPVSNATGIDDSVMDSDTTFRNFGNSSGDLFGSQIGKVGSNTTSSEDGDQGFKIALNGFKNENEYNVLFCSFDPSSDNYFSKVLNSDPSKIQEKGHYLYSHWDVESSVAYPSGSLSYDIDTKLAKGFLLHTQGATPASLAVSTKPEMENFESRFRTAKTPWFISQAYGLGSSDDRASTSSLSGCYELFRLHALDDGEAGNDRFRVLISNIRLGANSETFGSFDLTLEDFYSDPIGGSALISWKNLSLDPNSSNYIARVIGDEHIYYDFDKPQNRQRVVTTGKFKVTNNYVRVEMSSNVEEEIVPKNCLPVGHKALSTPKFDLGSSAKFFETYDSTTFPNFNASVAPVDMVKSISKVIGSGKVADQNLAWGIKFGRRKDGTKTNSELSEISFNNSVKSWTKFYPDMGNSPLVTSDDSYLNGYFTLEKVAVSESNGVIDWGSAEYLRHGDLSKGSNSQSRFLDLQSDAKTVNIKYLKFRTIMQGGFDGVNIFDKEKSELTSVAAFREANDEAGESVFSGPTIVSYKKALDVISDKSLTEFQLLAIPGIREPIVTDYAINACETRFDAMFVMDLEEFDQSFSTITDDLTVPHVRNTISKLESRVLDTSFAAAYFPDVVIKRPSNGSPLQVPPSVGILGAMSLNDSLADPWFAPAGLTRGKIDAINSKLTLNRELLNELYDVDINPIYEPAGRQGEVYAFGQKTLLQEQSALDRINVRRLLINLRRRVKNIALTFLFEPNRESTLARFSAAVEPILIEMQARQGVDRYKVQIDTTTTTQNDIENNTIRGKIYIQPTKTVEFVSIDFTVTNSID